MAKSTRSKIKRSFRAKKREEGVYAATEAGRLHRLNSKLTAKIDDKDEGLAEVVEPDATQGSSHHSGMSCIFWPLSLCLIVAYKFPPDDSKHTQAPGLKLLSKLLQILNLSFQTLWISMVPQMHQENHCAFRLMVRGTHERKSG